MTNMPISWISIDASELKDVSFERLSSEFRGDSIVGLVTHLDALKGSVLILFAPVEAAFCMPLRACCSNLCGMQDGPGDDALNKAMARAYLRDLRLAGIKKSDPQAILFGDFDRLFGSRGARHSLAKEVRYADEHRWFAIGCVREHEAIVKSFLERWFDQFEDYALVVYPEGRCVEMHDVNPIDPSNYTLGHWMMVWAIPVYWLGEEQGNDEISVRVIAALKTMIGRLESGLSCDIAEAGIDRIRRPLIIDCRPEFAHPRTAEVLCLRARFVRLWAHPAYFFTVRSRLPELREQWKVLAAGQDLPFDPVVELEAYLVEMLERYTVLGEAPFGAEVN